MKLIGLVFTALLIIRVLSDRIVTVDVGQGADLLRDVGGYTLNGGAKAGDRRLIVPYDPASGRIQPNAPAQGTQPTVQGGR